MPAGATCSICARPDAAKVDEQLVAGVSYAKIIFNMPRNLPKPSEMSLSRHRRKCLTPGLMALQVRSEASGGPTLAARVEQLYDRAEKVLDKAEKDGQGNLAIASVRELRGIVELLARLSGELDTSAKVQVLNVTTSPEWTDVRARIFFALQAFPEARLAVANALDAEPQAK